MKKPVRKAGAMGPGSMEKIGAKQGAANRLRSTRGDRSEDGFFAGSLNSAFGFNPTKNQSRKDAAKKLEGETGPLFAKADRDRKAGKRMGKAQSMQKANRDKLKK